jgi:hypothetical protein
LVTADFKSWDGIEKRLVEMPIVYTIFARMIMPAVSRLPRIACQAQSAGDMAAIAIASERYRLAAGTLPAALDALVPQYLAKVPLDPIDRQPLRYRPADGAYVLYSVGANGVDDGGQVAHTGKADVGFDKGDWVWFSNRQP